MAIVLKEAFRHQNFLDRLMGNVECYLSNSVNVMVNTEIHLRSKTLANAVDETKDNKADRTLQVPPDAVIMFLERVYSEKEKLSTAINNAKVQHCVELDKSIAVNKTRQRTIGILKRLATLKNKESLLKQSDYCFNNEGNQVLYYYDVEKTSKIDFDMAKVKKLISGLSADSDFTSNTIDYWLSSVPVDYTPFFDINSSFEELVEEFANTNMDMAS